jgi:hypothetical protein
MKPGASFTHVVSAFWPQSFKFDESHRSYAPHPLPTRTIVVPVEATTAPAVYLRVAILIAVNDAAMPSPAMKFVPALCPPAATLTVPPSVTRISLNAKSPIPMYAPVITKMSCVADCTAIAVTDREGTVAIVIVSAVECVLTRRIKKLSFASPLAIAISPSENTDIKIISRNRATVGGPSTFWRSPLPATVVYTAAGYVT